MHVWTCQNKNWQGMKMLEFWVYPTKATDILLISLSLPSFMYLAYLSIWSNYPQLVYSQCQNQMYGQMFELFPMNCPSVGQFLMNLNLDWSSRLIHAQLVVGDLLKIFIQSLVLALTWFARLSLFIQTQRPPLFMLWSYPMKMYMCLIQLHFTSIFRIIL
jgi:hypothetical protein